MKILIVEDEKNLRETITDFLKVEGYVCEQCDTVSDGAEKLDLYAYDCMLVDIGLPDGSGFELIKDLKKRHADTGIIIISARNSLDDKIEGLDLGADDYLAKPFHLTELNSRIKSVLRRLKFGGKKELRVGQLRILPEYHQVFADEQPITLTRKEFDLLIFFVSNPQRVLTKESIAEHLWGILPIRQIPLILSIPKLKTFDGSCRKRQASITSGIFTEQVMFLNSTQ